MPDKLTDSEIVKALECCINWKKEGDCAKCVAYDKPFFCTQELRKCSLDLINRLQAENERLKNELDIMSEEHLDILERLETAKAEAYKEFAERLHEELRMYGIKDKFNKVVFLNLVDKAKKELEEK